MNKVTKVALATGVTACVAGGVLFGLGVVSGGRQYLKAHDLDHPNGAVDNIVTIEKRELSSIRCISVDLEHMDFQIKTSDDQNAYVEYTVERDREGKDPITYDVKDGVFQLKEQTGADGRNAIQIDLSGMFGWAGPEEQYHTNVVTLYLPADTEIQSSTIAMEDGDLSAEGFHSSDAEWTLEYGDLDLTDCVLADGTVTMQDGDCEMEQTQIKRLNLEVSYGDVAARGCDINTAALRLKDGDVSLEDCTLKKPELTLDYGDLEWNESKIERAVVELREGDIAGTAIRFTGDNTINSAFGDVTLYLADEDVMIDARTKLGDGSGLYGDRRSDNTLTICCEEGDIVIP